MSTRSFEARFYRRNGDVALAVEQRGDTGASEGRRNGRASSVTVRAWGVPLRAVSDQVLDALRRSGHRVTALRAQENVSLPLAEPMGVRLALLLMAVKPLRKYVRIEQVAEGVRRMSDEEAYYWYAKCADPEHGRRARKALRVLLAPES